jgi:hypothetical protein
MDEETEVIKQQMAETREALSEKIDCLEQKVLRTVEGTTDMVANTAESVAEAVQGTVNKVAGAVDHAVDVAKESLDLRKQVQLHPWAMFAGSVAVGFMGGRLLMMAARSRFVPMAAGYAIDRFQSSMPSRAGEPGGFRPSASPRTSSILKRFEPALNKLKDVALTATSNIVSEMLVSAAPIALRDQLRQVVAEFSSALRGEQQPTSSSQEPESTEFPSQQQAADVTPPMPVPHGASHPRNRFASSPDKEGNGRSSMH